MSVVKIYEQGCSDFIVGELGADGFGDTSKKINGVMEIEMDLTEELGKISADNDPAFIKIKGPARGTGTIRLTAVPIDDYQLLTSALVGANKVIAIGEHTAVAERGFSFKKEQFDNATKSTNLIMVHKVTFGIPNEGSTSIDEDGIEIVECEIPFECHPAFYEEGSVRKRRTITKINSAKSSALYDTLKNKCFTPDEAELTTT